MMTTTNSTTVAREALARRIAEDRLTALIAKGGGRHDVAALRSVLAKVRGTSPVALSGINGAA